MYELICINSGTRNHHHSLKSKHLNCPKRLGQTEKKTHHCNINIIHCSAQNLKKEYQLL